MSSSSSRSLPLALGLLALLARVVGGLLRELPSMILPGSVRVRLMLANGGVLALTFLVGWVGFASLEEMHFRGHQLQLHAEWKHQLSEIEAGLEAGRIARTGRQDETVHELR